MLVLFIAASLERSCSVFLLSKQDHCYQANRHERPGHQHAGGEHRATFSHAVSECVLAFDTALFRALAIRFRDQL